MAPYPTRTWRARSREHDPAVLRRLLLLRQLPLFAGVDLDELVVVAENVIESSFLATEQVAPAGVRLPCVHLIIDGQVERAAGPPRTWAARQPLGLLEILAGRPLPSAAIATATTRTFELEGADLFDILEDNFGLLTSLLRMLATRVLDLGLHHPRLAPSPGTLLGLVDRMIVIREQIPFLAARMQPLAILAHAAREVTWPPGQAAAHGGELGALEVLAGRAHEITLTTTSATSAIALASTAVFDVLEDHPELGLATLSTLAATVLDAEAQGANATGTTIESNSRPVPSIACITSSSTPTSSST